MLSMFSDEKFNITCYEKLDCVSQNKDEIYDLDN